MQSVGSETLLTLGPRHGVGSRRPGTRRAAWLAVLLLLGGCVEVDETLEVLDDGGAVYRLQVAWDADLVTRLADHLPPGARLALAQRLPPLEVAAWDDACRAAEGVRLLEAEEGLRDDGWRVLRVSLAVERLEALGTLEPFARRPFAVSLERSEAHAAEEDARAREGDRARLDMDPLATAPLLDEAVDLLALLGRGPRGGTAPRPDAAAGLGLEAPRLHRLADVLEARLTEVRLAFTVRVSGAVETAGAARTRSPSEVGYVFGVGDLGPRRPRGLGVTWRPRRFDRVPTVRLVGDVPRIEVPSR